MAIETKSLEFKPNITIPGSDDFVAGVGTSMDQQNQAPLLIRYIRAIYKFFVGIAGIIAVFMIVFGGVIWLFSGGSSEKIGKAKEYILGAVFGLLIAVGSYMILQVINPSLVSYQLNLEEVPGITIPAYFCKDAKVADGVERLFSPVVAPDGFIGPPTPVNVDATVCGQDYYLPGRQDKVTCIGSGSCGSDKICGFDPKKSKKGQKMGTRCMTRAEACNSINDDVTGDLGLPDDQRACDSLDQKMFVNSACLWFDYSWWADWYIKDDMCVYYDKAAIEKVCKTYNKGSAIMTCADYHIDDKKIGLDTGEGLDWEMRQLMIFCKTDPCQKITNRERLNCDIMKNPNDGWRSCQSY